MNAEIIPGVKRSDVMKFATLGAANKARENFHSHVFIFQGDHDDARPYWLVSTSKAAAKFEAQGYTRA